ncbi:hypothetical protein ABPG75_006344 [Micractinium tetrahymenae]
MGPVASHQYCGLPTELSNFQGYFECDDAVKVGRPSSIEDVQALVSAFPHVKASGVGHSWWRQQFCAGNTSDSINIVMTELKPTLDFMAAPADPKQWTSQPVPPSFPIQVDEDKQTVTVAAGVTQRALLDYLSEYRYWKQPAGWTLGAFAWFLDQTIGGAVATASHGSSMRYGTLSAQLRGLKMVLANGSLVEFTPEKNPHLFRAAGVGVGRLGVTTEITLKIKPQLPVTRSLLQPSFRDFATAIKTVQDAYTAAKKAGDTEAMKRALFQVDETQAFWAVPTASVQVTSYSHPEKDPSFVVLNISPAGEPLVQGMNGPGDDVVAQVEKAPVPPNPRMAAAGSTRFWSNMYVQALRPKVAPGTFESRRAFLSMSDSETATTAGFAPYDQYEVAIPLERAGTCLMEVGNEIYNPARPLYDGFRTPLLLRFTTKEDLYLSPASDGPLMWINMEDYISRSSGRPNDLFQRTVQLFRQRCGARLHWGKAGWPQHAKCFQGAQEYPNTWCSFGCAVQELDPAGKFASEWDGWRWQATRGGQPVPFSSCCTASGFSTQCKCAPRSDCSAA